MAKRLIHFLRSVLPADSYQLLFLAGIVCLAMLRGLRWWPASPHVDPARVAGFFGRFVLNTPGIFMLPVIFATAAGYFVCFWPGKRPIRRILALVVFPSALSAILMLGRIVYLAGPPSSILQNAGTTMIAKLKRVRTMNLDSLGLHVAVIGLLLIGLFVLRLAFGVSQLPLALPGAGSEDSTEASSWRRVLILIWFFLAIDVVTGRFLLSLIVVSSPGWPRKPWFPGFALNLVSIGIFAIALLIADGDARKIIRESIAVPKYKWTGFALFFPMAVDILLAIVQRSVEGFPWSPRILIDLPETYSLPSFCKMFLVVLLPAFFEEVFFRGLLQKRFVRRYGLYRGIFLVCIAWAAFHMYSDFSMRHDSYFEIFQRLSGRVLMTVCTGFILSWLTLQSRSVVPAALCHALYNTLVFAPPGLVFAGMGDLRTTVWGVTAIILFRFWPPVPTEPGPEALPFDDVSPQPGSLSSGSPPPLRIATRLYSAK